MATYGYSTPYKGQASFLPQDYLRTATDPGRNIGGALNQFGGDLADAIGKYSDHKNQVDFYTQKNSDAWQAIQAIAQTPEAQREGTSENALLKAAMGISKSDSPQALMEYASKTPAMGLAKQKALAADLSYLLERYDKSAYTDQARVNTQMMKDRAEQERALAAAIPGVMGVPTTQTSTDLVPNPELRTINEFIPTQQPAPPMDYSKFPTAESLNAPAGSKMIENALKVVTTGPAGLLYDAIRGFNKPQQIPAGPPMQEAINGGSGTQYPIDLGNLNRDAVPPSLTDYTTEFQGPYTQTTTTKRPYADVLKDAVAKTQQAGARITPDTLAAIKSTLASTGTNPEVPNGLEVSGGNLKGGELTTYFTDPEIKNAAAIARREDDRAKRTVTILGKDYVATNMDQYKKIRDSAVGVSKAKPLFDDLIAISEQWDSGKLSLSDIAKASTDAQALRSALKEAVNGVGAMSDQDMQRLEKMIPNPTDWRLWKSQNIKVADRLREARKIGFSDVNANLKVMGFEPIDFEGKGSSGGSSGVTRYEYINGKLTPVK